MHSANAQALSSGIGQPFNGVISSNVKQTPLSSHEIAVHHAIQLLHISYFGHPVTCFADREAEVVNTHLVAGEARRRDPAIPI
jgi:hypothetical protein